jgi:ribosomal protein S25
MEYKPRVVDGIHITESHYVAFCGTHSGFGKSECAALESLEEAINAHLKSDAELEMKVVERLNYPERELREALYREKKEKAWKEREVWCKQTEEEILRQIPEEVRKHCGVHLDKYSERLSVRVDGAYRYNSYSHRQETVYAARNFPRGKTGYNWDKIIKAASQVALFNVKTAEQAEKVLQERTQVMNQLVEVKQAVGDNLPVMEVSGRLVLKVELKNSEVAIKAIRALQEAGVIQDCHLPTKSD